MSINMSGYNHTQGQRTQRRPSNDQSVHFHENLPASLKDSGMVAVIDQSERATGFPEPVPPLLRVKAFLNTSWERIAQMWHQSYIELFLSWTEFTDVYNLDDRVVSLALQKAVVLRTPEGASIPFQEADFQAAFIVGFKFEFSDPPAEPADLDATALSGSDDVLVDAVAHQGADAENAEAAAENAEAAAENDKAVEQVAAQAHHAPDEAVTNDEAFTSDAHNSAADFARNDGTFREDADMTSKEDTEAFLDVKAVEPAANAFQHQAPDTDHGEQSEKFEWSETTLMDTSTDANIDQVHRLGAGRPAEVGFAVIGREHGETYRETIQQFRCGRSQRKLYEQNDWPWRMLVDDVLIRAAYRFSHELLEHVEFWQRFALIGTTQTLPRLPWESLEEFHARRLTGLRQWRVAQNEEQSMYRTLQDPLIRRYIRFDQVTVEPPSSSESDVLSSMSRRSFNGRSFPGRALLVPQPA